MSAADAGSSRAPGGAPRRVLLVGRDYFFYTREIAAELRQAYGAEVTYLPIEPPGALYAWRRKLAPASAQRQLHAYHERALQRIRGTRFDLVLFIQVHQIGSRIELYRAAFPDARFVLYYWDSLRTHDYLPYVAAFDKVVSFDPQDVRDHPWIHYLPLFYCERFRDLRAHREFDADLSFVGVAVSLVRYEQLERFRRLARERGLTLVDYVMVSPFLYLRCLLRGRRLRGVHFRPLGAEALLGYYRRARAVLDLPNNAQTGCTMRTFECLGSHRKLVTTNARVGAEDFHSPDCVYVVRSEGGLPDAGFLRASVQFPAVIEQYALRAWLDRLLAPASKPTAPAARSPEVT